MHDSVLVALADRAYLDQAKQLFAAAHYKAGWKGDYLLLAHDMSREDLGWFETKGILTLECHPLVGPNWSKGDRVTASKCYLFSRQMKQWRNVVYLDVDVLLRGSLEGLTSVQGFNACHSMWQSVRDNFLPFEKLDPLIVDRIQREVDLTRDAFNSGVMAFETSIVEGDTMDGVLQRFIEYAPLSLFGGDQLPLNIYFNGWNRLPAVYNRIVQEDRDTRDAAMHEALAVHVVRFGQGPWNPGSVFFEEWRKNLQMAEAMELHRRVTVSSWSEERIVKASRRIIAEELAGGDIRSIRTLASALKRLAKKAWRDPKGAGRKLLSILRQPEM